MIEPGKRISGSGRVGTTNPTEQAPRPTWASRCLIVWLGIELTLCTFAYGGVHYWALGLLSLGAAVTIVLWALDSWSRNGVQWSAGRLQLPLIAICMLGLIQLVPWYRQMLPGDSAYSWVPASFDPFSTRLAIVSVAVFVIFFAASAFIDSRTRLRGIVTFLVILGAVVALVGLIQHFVSPLKIYGFREPFQALPFGPFIDRNHFAAFAVMILPLPSALLLERAVGRDRIPLYAGAIVLVVVATVMTGSRGALLTIVAVAGFLVIVQAATSRQVHTGSVRRRWILIAAAFGMGAVLIFSLVLFLGGSGSLRRVAGQSPTEDAAGGGRLHYWRATIKMFRDHPVIGVGLDAYGVAFPRYDTLNGEFRIERAHNDYLQTLAETGIIGSLIALAFVVILFWQGITAANRTRDPWRRAVTIGALAGCFGVLVHSFFEFPLRTPANALLFLLLAALATGGSELAPRVASLEPRGAERTELE